MPTPSPTRNWYDDAERAALCRTQPMEHRQSFYEELLKQEAEEAATVFVNVFNGARGSEAHDGVWTSRFDAVEAAEQYANTYEYTLTDIGKIDLSRDFSEEFQQKRDFDLAVDAKIAQMKEDRLAEAVA